MLPRIGYLADGVVSNVTLIVGVDDVLRRAAERGEGRDEAGAISRGVDGVEAMA